MKYNCGHCEAWILSSNTLLSLEVECQDCSALNTFHFSPVAISHRPPADIRQCTEENCNCRKSKMPQFALYRREESQQQSSFPDTEHRSSRT